ncbi:MAG: ribosomal RNA small subunit methyltransferase A [Nitrospira sp.]|nr:ribosomal RNA small subunit methyltransferase A [Nitrospira sp.]
MLPDTLGGAGQTAFARHTVTSSESPSAIKRLGQNFLIDPNIVRKILAVAELRRHDAVLEIGPGRGILTEALCHVSDRVTAIELDPRLHAHLLERHADTPNLTLVLGDAMTHSLEGLPIGTIVVANLPYYISTPLLFRLLEQRDRFPRLVLMLQDEVADRLIAKPGSRDYGVLSVLAQYVTEVTKAFKVSAHCFRPRPEVGSAVVVLRMKQARELSPEEEPMFTRLVKAAFAHRRKTLVNSLKDEGYDVQVVLEALRTCALEPVVRAETLPVGQFVELSRRVTLPRQHAE